MEVDTRRSDTSPVSFRDVLRYGRIVEDSIRAAKYQSWANLNAAIPELTRCGALHVFRFGGKWGYYLGS